MKHFLLISIVFVLVFLFLTASGGTSPVHATPTHYFLFLDEFNDGNADGWWLGYSHANHSVYGNWRVENGVLVQDMGGDGFVALVENFQISDQIIETKLKFNGPAGYGGFTLWFQDYNNLVFINAYPAADFISVAEWINGIGTGTTYSHPLNYDNAWHTMRVLVLSGTGDLMVYIDNEYLFTHHTSTTQRTGQSGLMNGNSGGYFDDFMVSSGDSAPTRCYLPLVHR
jgi:hypothetical protein